MRRFPGIKGKRPDHKEKKRKEAIERKAKSDAKVIEVSERNFKTKAKVAVD